MNLKNLVAVNTHYTRSVNIERDANSPAVVEAYLPTSRALRTLARVSEALGSEDQPRAWTLVGPYGSGKSSFSVFLSHLLGDPADKATAAAVRVLAKHDKALAKRFDSHAKDSHGYLKVLITGAPEPMAKRLLAGIRLAIEGMSGKSSQKAKALIKDIERLEAESKVSTTSLVKLIERLQAAAGGQGGYRGVLIVVDELGKFLEYEARHYGANDIFLLQTLAEHAYKRRECNLMVFVLLHQTFEQYAKGLSETLRNEWAKVQGRFEEVPFVESSEQTLRIVAEAFRHDWEQEIAASGRRPSKEGRASSAGGSPKAHKAVVTELVEDAVAVLAAEGALPATLTQADAGALFTRCYPLHPLSALLLPALCQKVAQNERTLFSYLGSQEEHGLQDLLSRLSFGEWVRPAHVFDYFIANQSASISDRATHRRWAEVITALERLGDAQSEQVELLKTIGLLNIIGSKGGLKASEALLGSCFSDERRFKDALKSLTKSSLITYRKFSGEYRVWQGSDFDLDAAIEAAQAALGQFALAEELNRISPLMPVVARRYTIQVGALRYFEPVFSDAKSYLALTKEAKNPRIVLFLAGDQDDVRHFVEEVKGASPKTDILALYRNGVQLRDAVGEVLALRHIGNSRPELNSDPVAKREYHDRLVAAEAALDIQLKSLLDYPGDSEWYWGARHLSVRNRRELQEALSTLLSRIYDKSPALHNELINRDRPSSQAAAGRNKLLAAMVHNAELPDLGIDAERYPPEKAMYRALLAATGLHARSGGSQNCFEFLRPTDDSTLAPAWAAIEEFFATTEDRQRNFEELQQVLVAPPYGLKQGVIPILVVAAYLVNQHELAVYENRMYLPQFTEESLERFVKTPAEFTVQRFRIDGMRGSIMEQYQRTLFTDGKKRSVVDLVRPLARFIEGLDEYTKRTKSPELSDAARGVRNAFLAAQSPEALLFVDLPKALGFDGRLAKKPSKADLEEFSQALTEALRELKRNFGSLLQKQQRLLAQAFHMEPTTELGELRRAVAGRYFGLDQYTIDIDGLKAFIKRLTKAELDDAAWLQNVLMFLGKKPVEKWTDTDRAEADLRLADFAKRMLDLETLRLHEDRASAAMQGDFDVYVLKTLKKGADAVDEVVAVDRRRREALASVRQELSHKLAELSDKELQLAALAELVDDFLREYQAPAKPAKKQRSLKKVADE